MRKLFEKRLIRSTCLHWMLQHFSSNIRMDPWGCALIIMNAVVRTNIFCPNWWLHQYQGVRCIWRAICDTNIFNWGSKTNVQKNQHARVYGHALLTPWCVSSFIRLIVECSEVTLQDSMSIMSLWACLLDSLMCQLHSWACWSNVL